MKYTLTDKILLLMADYCDFYHASFSVSRALSYVSGDPALRKHRLWMEEYFYNKKKRKNMFNTLYMLYRRKVLKRVVSKGNIGYILTPEAENRVLKLRIRQKKRKKLPQRRILMVFFDIPEKKKKVREHLRNFLKMLGFENLQKSIWISPYDVAEEVKKFSKNCDINKEVQMLVISQLTPL